jgi:hypothetical protein
MLIHLSTRRAIVHPRILTFRNIRDNVRELLSYSEFSQPWRLYLLPGLLNAQLCHTVWIGLVTRLVRHITVPSLGGLPPSTPAAPGDDTYSGPSSAGNASLSTFGLAVFLCWCVLSVIVLSPLECAIVRLSVQRPERQQPLHLAYARVSSSSSAQPTGPAPYNNQAQVGQQVQSQGQTANEEGEPTDPAPRPSFAIEDEEDDSGGNDQNGETKPLSGSANGPEGQYKDSTAARQSPRPQNTNTLPTHNTYRAGNEPTEPVIALRPCDEPSSAEEAAQAESEGFGAPTVERYQGMIDCLNKLVDEEGIEALYRGAWVTLLGILAGNFS